MTLSQRAAIALGVGREAIALTASHPTPLVPNADASGERGATTFTVWWRSNGAPNPSTAHEGDQPFFPTADGEVRTSADQAAVADQAGEIIRASATTAAAHLRVDGQGGAGSLRWAPFDRQRRTLLGGPSAAASGARRTAGPVRSRPAGPRAANQRATPRPALPNGCGSSRGRVHGH